MRKKLPCLLFGVLFMMLLSSIAAAQTSRESVSAAEVNGTFKMNFKGKYKSFSNELKILALGGGKIRFAMDLVYPYTLQNGDAMVHMGTLDDKASITGDTAIFKSDDSTCTITIKFTKPGMIKVEQEGADADCGFGHNVFSRGIYKKVNSKKPTFDNN